MAVAINTTPACSVYLQIRTVCGSSLATGNREVVKPNQIWLTSWCVCDCSYTWEHGMRSRCTIQKSIASACRVMLDQNA